MRISDLNKFILIALVANSGAEALNLAAAESASHSTTKYNQAMIHITMQNFLNKLGDNQPWDSYAQYLDYPDAGNPDCGMFIESYTITKISIQNKLARVKVNYQVKGEFAGTDYYKYPKPQIREVDYDLVDTTRSWQIKEESGMTNYIPLHNKKASWKIKDGDIRLLNIKYLGWHFNYYNSDKHNRLVNSTPKEHCWQ